MAGRQRRDIGDAGLGTKRRQPDNLNAVVDAFNTAGITVQSGYYSKWYWSEPGGGDLSGLANVLVSAAYPDGHGYPSTIYANCGGDSGEGWMPYGNASPGAWQFTNAASIAAIRVDCNAFLGADMATLFGSTTPIAHLRPTSGTAATPNNA
jgi:hypothetical protein